MLASIVNSAPANDKAAWPEALPFVNKSWGSPDHSDDRCGKCYATTCPRCIRLMGARNDREYERLKRELFPPRPTFPETKTPEFQKAIAQMFLDNPDLFPPIFRQVYRMDSTNARE